MLNLADGKEYWARRNRSIILKTSLKRALFIVEKMVGVFAKNKPIFDRLNFQLFPPLFQDGCLFGL